MGGYRNEAESQRRFGELLRSAPPVLRDTFQVPEVVGELSSERVLCSTWVRVRSPSSIHLLCAVGLLLHIRV